MSICKTVGLRSVWEPGLWPGDQFPEGGLHAPAGNGLKDARRWQFAARGTGQDERLLARTVTARRGEGWAGQDLRVVYLVATECYLLRPIWGGGAAATGGL